MPLTVPVNVGLLIGAYGVRAEAVMYPEGLDVEYLPSSAVCKSVCADKVPLISPHATEVVPPVVLKYIVFGSVPVPSTWTW